MEEKGKRKRPTMAQVKEKEREYNNLLEEYVRVSAERDALQKSNRIIEQEMERRGDIIDKLTDDNIYLRKENARLENRSFWDRIFNK